MSAGGGLAVMVFAFTGSPHFPQDDIVCCLQVLSLDTVAVSQNVNCQIPPLTHRRAGGAFFPHGQYQEKKYIKAKEVQRTFEPGNEQGKVQRRTKFNKEQSTTKYTREHI